MVSINDNAILDRIKEYLEDPTNDIFGNSANDPKFEKIQFGDPAKDNKLKEAGNICYIRMGDRPLAATKKKLRNKGGRKRKLETREVWMIIVTGNGSVLETVLRELNDLTFKTREALEKNIFLKKADGTLPIAHDLEIFDVPRDVENIGSTRQAQNIVCRYDFSSE